MGSIVITKNLILFNDLGTDLSSRQESGDSCGGVYWERGILKTYSLLCLFLFAKMGMGNWEGATTMYIHIISISIYIIYLTLAYI